MKERPILFSGPMVRAILEGHKTVTRRPVKVQPRDRADIGSYGAGQPFIRHPDPTKRNQACPYGQPGDRLWVRETWQGPLISDEEQAAHQSWWKDLKKFQDPAHCAYRASGDDNEYVDPDGDFHCKWKPSIHMPRWASRILLEITGVRIERLQDISEEQAVAEGVHFDKRRWFTTDEGGPAFIWPQHAFEHLWRSINGADSWAANPWVWVVEFKRVTP